ncbi:MAG TPA: XRE family transcriptional regulator [Acidobacteriaceae bacterium]|nr:XRE family transcriptional regulator [Acidobacteriaceae bacterium]
MATKKSASKKEPAPQVARSEAQSRDQVDPSSAEAFIAERRIGERIKRLRLKKSMGLVELGKHTGLSASFLSQLETGRVVPTLRNLARIAMVFNKDLSYFFEPEAHTLFRIHKKADRVRLPQSGVDNPTYFFESLAYMVPDRSLDPYYAEFIPLKGVTDIRPHVHPGYEFLYVLEGSLEIKHGDKANIIEAGDSVYFDASTPHAYRCAGKESAVALIVTMHQPPVAQPTLNLRPLGSPLGARSSQNSSVNPSPSVEKPLGTLPQHVLPESSILRRS